MSLFDDTAADFPVRDITLNLPRSVVDTSGNANARVRQDILRMTREELEDRFLRLNDENLHFKQHINKQDDKIKKLATKLMRLVKDRSRLEQLAAGVAQPASRVRDVAMEEMMEELQDNVRSLQSENEGLKQRLRVAKQQIIHQQSRRSAPYGHIHSRVNTGIKKLRDTPSPSPARPKSATRSLDGAGRPPTGQLPRYGHSLLEDARAEIRNLENVIESQRSHMEQLQGDAQLLRDELRKKEEQYEERLLDVRQQQTSNLRSHVSGNMTMIKLQKQLAERSNAITELEGRFLQLQESQRRLKASHDTAMGKVDELSGQLKDERLRSLDLEKRLKSSTVSNVNLEQLQDQISELEQERDLLKDNNNKLLNSAFDVSQQQKWQIQEQKLRLQISQLETALQADLVDKNEILDKIKAERDANERLTEENKKIHIQFLEQKQQLEELKDRLKFYSKESEYDIAELTEALLLIKKRKSQMYGDLGFLKDVDADSSVNPDSTVRELRAAHAETIQELEKTRSLLSMESKICRGYKAELEAVSLKMKSDKMELEQRLEHQAKLLDSRAAKIRKLEVQLKDIAYGTKAYVFKPDVTEEDDVDEFNESLHLERGENVLELHVVSVSLSPSALETLSDTEPSTFCTYSFYLFDLHATPVMTGRNPKYGFTSKYVVTMDEQFLDFLNRNSVTVELHQALGLEWRTLATGRLRLQPLLDQEGKIHGTVPLVGLSDEVRSFGSLDYWLRLRIPMRETMLLYKEKVKAVGYVNTSLNKPMEQPSLSDEWNELCVTVHRCSKLRSRTAPSPSPYVVYRFYDSPDYPTATVHDSADPQFNDVKLYAVLMDVNLHQFLKSNVLQFYVFDDKEEQMEVYLGKAKVPLLSLAQDKAVTGVFELSDPSGLPSGHIEVSLKWKLAYLPPPGSDIAAEEPKFFTKERPVKETTKPKQEPPKIQEVIKDKPLTEPSVKEERQKEKDTRDTSNVPLVHPNVDASKAPLPKLRQRTLLKEGPTARKVTFVEESATEKQPVSEVTLAAPQTTVEEEDEEEESHFSEGQLLAASSQSLSDDSDQISEDITEDVQVVPKEDQSQSTDSDDCIVQTQATGRKASERIRVEVVSLSLRPESRVSRDDSLVRLFVEYSLLDLPTEETPVSLPKPPQGKSINYNYSKVIPVDVETNAERRRLLSNVLRGRNPQMERIRFTLVSEPPEEEEQERECEDVGVAFLRIPEILQKKQDLTEVPLNVLDAEDDSEVIGVLTVSVEGLAALESIMADAQLD